MPRHFNLHKVKAKRIKFNNTGLNIPGIVDINDTDTKDIISKPIINITKSQAIDKLFKYEVADKDALQISKWYRYINTDTGKLHGGGFLIKDMDKYVALKNISLNFTFSVQKANSIFFKTKQRSNFSGIREDLLDLFFQYKPKKGPNFVLVDKNTFTLHSGVSLKALHRNTPNSSINGMSKAFKKDNDKYKHFFLFKLSSEDIIKFRSELTNLPEEQEEKIDEPSIDQDVLRIINRYY